MTVNNAKELTRGDTGLYSFALYDKEGAEYIPEEGETITFYLLNKDCDDLTEAILVKDIVQRVRVQAVLHRICTHRVVRQAMRSIHSTSVTYRATPRLRTSRFGAMDTENQVRFHRAMYLNAYCMQTALL